MLAAPRRKGVAQKVFLKVMGKPLNQRDDKTPKQKRIDRKLIMNESFVGG